MPDRRASQPKPVAAVLGRASAIVSGQPTGSTNQIMSGESPSTRPLSERQTAKLWVLMGDAFGSKWVSQHGETDAGGTWSKGLSGLTGADIARGMAVLVRSGAEWPPALPEFRAMCVPGPEQVGAPDVDDAYRQACRNAHPAAGRRWSNAVVFHAAVETGFQLLLVGGADRSRARFEREYCAAIKRAVDGEPLHKIPDVDAPVLVKISDPAVAHANIQAMRQLLVKGVAHAC